MVDRPLRRSMPKMVRLRRLKTSSKGLLDSPLVARLASGIGDTGHNFLKDFTPGAVFTL